MRASTACLLAGVILLGASRPPAPPRAEILGRWRGTSICVAAPWNAACKDEVIIYRFVAIPDDTTRVLLHAFKLVNGVEDLMGDLPCSFDADSGAWLAPFANGRVSLVWSYRTHGDSLTGQVVLLPERRIGRHVAAVRDSS